MMQQEATHIFKWEIKIEADYWSWSAVDTVRASWNVCFCDTQIIDNSKWVWIDKGEYIFTSRQPLWSEKDESFNIIYAVL